MWRSVQQAVATIGVLLLLVSVGGACSASSEMVELPGGVANNGTEPTGQLLVSAGDDVEAWVARVDLETGEVERLTEWGLAASGRWSPDGETIAAAGLLPSNAMALHMINADGPVTVLTEERDNALPAWAPDCERLAFVHVDEVGFDIWTMDIDGSNRVRVTDHGGSVATGPDWSRDGQRIIFHSDRDGNFELYSVRPDGTDEQRLTNNDAADEWPRWSPDGDSIVFQRAGSSGSDVVVANADGSNARQVATGDRVGSSPVWSPDGEWIAYRRGDGQLGLIRVDGSDERVVSTTIEVDAYPTDWGPHEGTCLATGESGQSLP